MPVLYGAVHVRQSQPPSFIPFSTGVYMLVLYVCVSVSAPGVDSSQAGSLSLLRAARCPLPQLCPAASPTRGPVSILAASASPLNLEMLSPALYFGFLSPVLFFTSCTENVK